MAYRSFPLLGRVPPANQITKRQSLSPIEFEPCLLAGGQNTSDEVFNRGRLIPLARGTNPS